MCGACAWAMRVRVGHARARACARVCVCVRACVFACVFVCVCLAHVRACVLECVRVCVCVLEFGQAGAAFVSAAAVTVRMCCSQQSFMVMDRNGHGTITVEDLLKSLTVSAPFIFPSFLPSFLPSFFPPSSLLPPLSLSSFSLSLSLILCWFPYVSRARMPHAGGRCAQDVNQSITQDRI